MTDLRLPLVILAVLFGLLVLIRMRPTARKKSRESREALEAAEAKIAAAPNEVLRALALCEAGEACVARWRRNERALGYFLKAMKADPTSTEIVERAVNALDHRPRALEAVLWRRLAVTVWGERNGAATKLALRALSEIYGTKLRNPTRGRALTQAIALLGR